MTRHRVRLPPPTPTQVSAARTRVNLRPLGLSSPAETRGFGAMLASLPRHHPQTLPLRHPAVQRHRCGRDRCAPYGCYGAAVGAVASKCRSLDDEGPWRRPRRGGARQAPADQPSAENAESVRAAGDGKSSGDDVEEAATAEAAGAQPQPQPQQGADKGAELMTRVLWDREERRAVAEEFMRPALDCLRLTTPNLTLAYPADARAHFEELRRALAAWWTWRPLRREHGQQYVEMEDAWHMHFEAALNASGPEAPLHPIFGPYVPLFVCWYCQPLVFDAGLVATLRRVLRPDVAYITLAVADDGITGSASSSVHRWTAERAHKHVLRMREMPNVVVLSGGGYGHVPYPPMKNPLVPLLPRVPVAARRHLVSYVGNLAHGPGHPTLRSRMRRVVVAMGDALNFSHAITHGAPEWRALMADARASFAPRGQGRSTFLLAEIVNMGLVPIHVYSDVAWVPYARLFEQLGFLSDLPGLPSLLARLHAMPPAELEARERRAAELNASHFLVPGVLEQIGLFMRAPTASDLVCQKLPPTTRDMAADAVKPLYGTNE